MKIPSDNKWTQTNDGNIFGVLHETHNVNFDRNGEITLTPRAAALMSDTSDSDFGIPLAILYFNGAYNIVTSDSVFRGTLSGSEFTEVASTPQLSEYSDAIVFNSKLYVTTETSLSSLSDTSVWTNSLDTYTSGYPHPMCEFASMTTYKLAVGNKNQVETLDTSHNANSTVLTIPSNYVITTLAYRSGYLYIGTKEINGGEAMIFMWNGSGTNAQYSVATGAQWVYSIIPYKSSVCAITNEGELLYVEGTSATRLAVLPVFNVQGARWEQGSASIGKVAKRGMASLGDNVYVNVCGTVGIGDVSEMKSGLWCYDPDTGFTHYSSTVTDLWVKDSSITLASSVITTSANHGLQTGDPVVFTSVAGITNLTSWQLYYAIPVTANTLKISGSRKGADDGEYVQLGGSPTTDTIQYVPNIERGDVGNATSGPVIATNYLDSSLNLWNSDFMWAGIAKDSTDASRKVLNVVSSGLNTGSFTTQRINTANVSQMWKAIYAFVNGAKLSNEQIIIKERAGEVRDIEEQSLTWTGTNTFVITNHAVTEQIEVGDEVVILSGCGQGRYAHVTEVEYSVNTTVVTIDEAYGTNGATATARFTNFKKLATITNTRDNLDTAFSSLDVAKATWVQFKVEVRGFSPSISQMEIVNSVNKSAV